MNSRPNSQPTKNRPFERPFRIAVVTSHPIQYSTPLYAYLHACPEFDITVLFCSDFSLRGAEDPGFGEVVTWDVDLLAGYRSIFLGSRARKRELKGFWSLVCPELIREIDGQRFDAVWVHGTQFAAYLLAFAIAKIRGIPVMTRGDTHLGLHRQAWRAAVRKAVLGAQFKLVDRFLATGTANHEYYRTLGAPEDRIFDLPFSVDNERFKAGADLSAAEREAARQELGVSDDTPIVLYCSKFAPLKHPEQVVRAVAELCGRGLRLHLVMAGSGAQAGPTKELAIDLGLSNVSFPGFVNQSRLPRLFAASDIFVLPAENEAWGLIVNEVMCAGLPVVVGDTVGCVPDLVKPGVNGATCKAGDVASLVESLIPLVTDPALRARMGAASRGMINSWGYEQAKAGLLEAIADLPRR